MKKEEFGELFAKVPCLKKKNIVVLTIFYISLLIALTFTFLWGINQLGWWGPLLSQFLLSVIVCLISYFHFKVAQEYREKYQDLAYQRYFYIYILPYLITWYGLFFHPVFLWGTRFVPWWIDLILASFCGFLMVSATIQIEKAGFIMATHGMDVYTIYPEETKIVRGEIYGYIRHPLYFTLFFGGIAMAFIAGTWIALGVAMLQIIPCFVIGVWEDQELIKRSGEAHMEYINQTNLIIPLKNIFKFLKLLLIGS